MKKAIVIGGSNGLGLALARNMISEGLFVEILDRCPPDPGMLDAKCSEYHFCDLMFLDLAQISELAHDPEVSLLMITAGVGRIADFEYVHPAEIQKMMTVNVTSSIQILRLFYERVKSADQFFCGIVSSIAGLLSSPSAAVYAASKAAICRFVESINIELEASGVKNRILNICPSSFNGSRFYGGENHPELLSSLSTEIMKRLFASDVLFIPQYEETFRDVIRRYQVDSHEYGLHSYEYKKNSGRLDNEKRVVIGFLSGTFDLFHVGHLNLFRRARAQCDYLIVGVHDSGAWKGKETFIPFEERKAIVGACKYVDQVVDACVEDSDAWDLWHFDRLFVGSDYKGTERFNRYEEFFKNKGVEIVYFPYTQSTSSTQIRKTVLLKTKDIKIESEG